MIRKKTTFRNKKEFVVANHFIRFPQVRVLDESGEMLGIMNTSEAVNKATELGKDLVLVTASAKPPVTKIIELSKFKYQQQQKASKQRKSSKKQDTKELRFSIFIGEADFQARIKRIFEFIKKGDKVRLTLNFKGRQIAKKDLAYDIFKRIFEITKDVTTIEIEPKIIGKKMMAQIAPTNKQKKSENAENQTQD